MEPVSLAEPFPQGNRVFDITEEFGPDLV